MQPAQGGSFSDQARRQAQQILSRSPYKAKGPSHSPAPLAGFLHAVGRLYQRTVDPVWHWIQQHIFSPIHTRFSDTFGTWAGIVAIGIAIALGVAIAILLERHRTRTAQKSAPPVIMRGPDDPDRIERDALRYENEGDFDKALRLRFQAGLLRLERSGYINDRLVKTNTQVSAQINSPNFDKLAHRHEEVVYAGDIATSADSDEAKQSWPRVITEAATPGDDR
jgi:hypothetical protein